MTEQLKVSDVLCIECGNYGTHFVDRGTVVHENTVCQLPPRVQTPTIKRPWFPSPWKLKLDKVRAW